MRIRRRARDVVRVGILAVALSLPAGPAKRAITSEGFADPTFAGACP